jgi:hypothetical protein
LASTASRQHSWSDNLNWSTGVAPAGDVVLFQNNGAGAVSVIATSSTARSPALRDRCDAATRTGVTTLIPPRRHWL